jgi:hypothetical protein
MGIQWRLVYPLFQHVQVTVAEGGGQVHEGLAAHSYTASVLHMFPRYHPSLSNMFSDALCYVGSHLTINTTIICFLPISLVQHA